MTTLTTSASTGAGCGQALDMAALVLHGEQEDAVLHLIDCRRCRAALRAVGDIARGATGIAYIDRHAVPAN